MIHHHRYTHSPLSEPVTVFLIGMRANRLGAVGKVFWTARQMPAMLRHLEESNPAAATDVVRCTRCAFVLAIAEHLHRFAADPDAPHLEPWRNFNRIVGTDVGVWHETYRVQPGHAEGVYVNMPVFGLAEAVGHEPVGPGSRSARQRLGRQADAAAPAA